MPDPAAATADDRDLARAGYRPQFRRGLGSFTAFAAGFSYLSILTGIVQNFYLGYLDAFNPMLDYGLSANAVTHNLTVNGIYQLPFFQDRKDAIGYVLGG